MNMAPYLSLGISGQASLDNFGNLRIPFLVDSDATTDIDGWRQINPEDDTQYVGIIGIPFAVPRTETLENVTFFLQSWYWRLVNVTLGGPEAARSQKYRCRYSGKFPRIERIMAVCSPRYNRYLPGAIDTTHL
jgi:hypothetical protein